ncbi:spore coat protein CotY [Lentibacillus halophilus]|uniref:Spore coat protein CotY n=1 Tax=Lentibacillus halophilus TaxID=295065 RepID=A0ABP3IY58_9BACI
MGCGKYHETGNCVCDILKEIANAQNDVVENCCTTSCEKSINDLLGDTDQGNGLDTVPVILYCEDNCEPFKGFGANPDNIGDMMASFYFRVKRVDDDCCAVVELLRDPGDTSRNPDNPVDQDTSNLRATGICITVDSNCFCHVTCLPAINAF